MLIIRCFRAKDGYTFNDHILKSMSKVCADESTVASSPTCDRRFFSGFLQMRASTLQVIILQ